MTENHKSNTMVKSVPKDRNQHVKEILETTKKFLPDVFENESEKNRYLGMLANIYYDDEKFKKLDSKEVAACALQLFLRGANIQDGEGFIYGFNSKDKFGNKRLKATVQTGYKYALKRLYETGEILKYPEFSPIKKSEVENFNPHTQEVELKKNLIKTEKEFEKWEIEPVVGYMVTFEMANPRHTIRKFFWKKQLVDHEIKYSQSYRKFLKDHNKDNIWATHEQEMLRKACILRTITLYLPKTSRKIKDAITDINRLNQAHYKDLSKDAKPEYVDNPSPHTNEKEEEVVVVKDTSQPREKTFNDLNVGNRFKAWRLKIFSGIKDKKEKSDYIKRSAKKLMDLKKIPVVSSMGQMTEKDYLEVLVPWIEKHTDIADLKTSLDSPVGTKVQTLHDKPQFNEKGERLFYPLEDEHKQETESVVNTTPGDTKESKTSDKTNHLGKEKNDQKTVVSDKEGEQTVSDKVLEAQKIAKKVAEQEQKEEDDGVDWDIFNNIT